jgi:uncharacterized protein (DUF1810 family)
MTGLERFRSAQASPDAGFEAALREIRAGRKTGHWIWYVLPQLSGLGTSAMSRTFGLRDAAEATAFLRDPELGARLATIVTAIAAQLAAHPGLLLSSLMGSEIDARKLVSSLTLFERVAARLDESDAHEQAGQVADAARKVLATAAAEGYPRCAFTLQRLAGSEQGE